MPYLFVSVPDYPSGSSSGTGTSPMSYLLLGQGFPAGSQPGNNHGDDLLVRAGFATESPFFIEDGPDLNGASALNQVGTTVYFDHTSGTGIGQQARGTAASQAITDKLITECGWRDHTDGHRLSTTVGDRIDVVAGNFKRVVFGRRPPGFPESETVADGAPPAIASMVPSVDASGGHFRSIDIVPEFIQTTSYITATGAGMTAAASANSATIGTGTQLLSGLASLANDLTGTGSSAAWLVKEVAENSSRIDRFHGSRESRFSGPLLQEEIGSAMALGTTTLPDTRGEPNLLETTFARSVRETTTMASGAGFAASDPTDGTIDESAQFDTRETYLWAGTGSADRRATGTSRGGSISLETKARVIREKKGKLSKPLKFVGEFYNVEKFQQSEVSGVKLEMEMGASGGIALGPIVNPRNMISHGPGLSLKFSGIGGNVTVGSLLEINTVLSGSMKMTLGRTLAVHQGLGVAKIRMFEIKAFKPKTKIGTSIRRVNGSSVLDRLTHLFEMKTGLFVAP